jgi:hypothetical protein
MSLKLKRNFLKNLTFALLAPTAIFISRAHSSNRKIFQPLADALLQTQKPVLISVASDLLAKKADDYSYSLHLRSANLNTADAVSIATGIKVMHAQYEVRLDSFSVSYNTNLKRQGLASLLSNLPKHLKELGIVSCNLNDDSASLISDFISSCKSLRMVCVEGNNFSEQAKREITVSGSKLTGCVTIV